MSIEKLIRAARETEVTRTQVTSLRARLKRQEDKAEAKSSSESKSFLSRTYSL